MLTKALRDTMRGRCSPRRITRGNWTGNRINGRENGLLKSIRENRVNPIKRYVPRLIHLQEQMDELETDNQVSFREYLKTNPADRVERAFFKPPFAEG